MKLFTIFFIILIGYGTIAPCYLWETYRDGERSCCLFIPGSNGGDFCNPYVPCTRNAAYDLNGIFDYISRVLVVDKGSSFSYVKLLENAQEFIRHVLMSGMRMYYRFDEHRKPKFYHEIAETVKSSEKTSKATTAVANAGAAKQKDEDVVTAMLVKMGLAWYHPQQSKNK